jgi:hypothetical protein
MDRGAMMAVAKIAHVAVRATGFGAQVSSGESV